MHLNLQTCVSLTIVAPRFTNAIFRFAIKPNDYAAYDNSSDITVSGNIMTGMTAKYICSTLYDNGRTAGKSSYNISDNYWDGAVYNGFVIEGNYGPSKPEFISDTAPRASADPQ